MRVHVDRFMAEVMPLLEGGIRQVFADQLDDLAVPPERLARIVRTGLHGLVVELSYARTPTEFAQVRQAYEDLRGLFARVVADGPVSQETP